MGELLNDAALRLGCRNRTRNPPGLEYGNGVRGGNPELGGFSFFCTEV